jgi:hypothetical protein
MCIGICVRAPCPCHSRCASGLYSTSPSRRCLMMRPRLQCLCMQLHLSPALSFNIHHDTYIRVFTCGRRYSLSGCKALLSRNSRTASHLSPPTQSPLQSDVHAVCTVAQYPLDISLRSVICGSHAIAARRQAFGRSSARLQYTLCVYLAGLAFGRNQRRQKGAMCGLRASAPQIRVC